jgi:DNA mismatch repair ATPase MutS
VLERIERVKFTSAGLVALRAALDSHGAPPSHRIARLRRIAELIDSRDNVAMRMIGPPLLYGTHLAFAAEAWRLASGSAVRRWVDAVGEIEALSSLAGYAWERPADPFPSIVPGSAFFEGEALGHPLLPDDRFIRNDVKLGGNLRLLIVSGSNMSGKSTLLRTAGVNAVLALAGAPVRAKSLSLSPLSIGASIRVTDSLQGGTSRFYAEIKRLRQIVDLAAAGPLLFLLDELLHGTNSHDRRIGAEAVVCGLVERGAIGLITTHDLALTHIAETLGDRAVNVHFEDHIENGQINFDYRLRAGIVTKSNALELMRSVGLDV